MTIKTHQQLWAECSAELRLTIGDEAFDAAFGDVLPYGLQDGVLRLRVPSEAYFLMLEQRYGPEFQKALSKVYGSLRDLQWLYPDNSLPQPKTVAQPEISPAAAPASGNNPAKPKARFNPNLSPIYNLDEYCRSDCNKVAWEIVNAIAERPGQHTFNPLYIFGPTGCGKTHLMQGLGRKLLEKDPDLRVLYIPARDFQGQYTTAEAQGNINQFYTFYQSVNVLFVDDIQELSGKRKTQNAFFNIFNHLYLNNRLVIFSSDRAPADIESFEDRLLGRLRQGAIVEMMKPDLRLRREVLRLRAEQNDMPLPEDVIEYVAVNITESIRELDGVMLSMRAQYTFRNKEFNLDLAREVVNNSVRIDKTVFNFDLIADKVCEYYNLENTALFSKSRKREISDARQIVAYLSKKHTDMPLMSIASCLNRNHATIIYGIDCIRKRLGVDKQLQEDINNIENSMLK